MSRILPTVLGLAAAGAIGAFAAVVVAGSSRSDAAPAAPGDSELLARVDDLSQQVSRLTEEVKTLKLAPPMREMAAPAALAPSDEAGTAEAEMPTELTEGLRDSVEAVVEEKQMEAQERMGRRFSKMAEQREKSTLDKLAAEHGLTAYQRTEMEAILKKRREVIGGFFRSMFSGQEGEVDMASAREKMQEVQRESDAQIQEILTPEQYDSYQAEQSQRGWMGGGMRGGPGSGRGGGGTNPGGGR